MITKKNFLYALPFLTSMIFLVFFLQDSKKSEMISCTADSILHIGSDQVKGFYTVKMSDGHGEATLIGQLLKNEDVVGQISRQIKFNYTSEGSNYYITTSIAKRLQMDTLTDDTQFLADVFTKNVKDRTLEIHKNGSSGWVFIIYSTPFFFCNKA